MPPKGRPPTPDDQQAVAVRLERRHLAMLDSYLQDDLRAEIRVSQRMVEKKTAADGKSYFLERRVHLPTERRRLLGRILEWYGSVHQTSTVRILAPIETEDPARNREVEDWIAREEARLTEHAPDAVKVALAKIQVRRMEREDPAALVRLLRAGRAAKRGNAE